MEYLSYGYKVPQQSDRGKEIFDAFEDNFERVNDHNHDGINSPPLSLNAFATMSVPVTETGWDDLGGGTFRKLITVPEGITYGTRGIRILDASRDQLFLTTNRVSDTTFYIFTNSPTLVKEVLFSV